MNLFEMITQNNDDIHKIIKKSLNVLPENQYKIVVCQCCGKPNKFSYSNLYEKVKIGRKIIKKCKKCNESIILKKD